MWGAQLRRSPTNSAGSVVTRPSYRPCWRTSSSTFARGSSMTTTTRGLVRGGLACAMNFLPVASTRWGIHGGGSISQGHNEWGPWTDPALRTVTGMASAKAQGSARGCDQACRSGPLSRSAQAADDPGNRFQVGHEKLHLPLPRSLVRGPQYRRGMHRRHHMRRERRRDQLPDLFARLAEHATTTALAAKHRRRRGPARPSPRPNILESLN